MQKNVIGFDKSAGLLILANHAFTTEGGQLVHHIDGKLRAVVPPEGWGDYVREWPEAGEVVDSLRLAPAPSPAASVETDELIALRKRIAELEGAANELAV